MAAVPAAPWKSFEAAGAVSWVDVLVVGERLAWRLADQPRLSVVAVEQELSVRLGDQPRLSVVVVERPLATFARVRVGEALVALRLGERLFLVLAVLRQMVQARTVCPPAIEHLRPSQPHEVLVGLHPRRIRLPNRLLRSQPRADATRADGRSCKLGRSDFSAAEK
jgi:hypothetical protein